MDNEFILQDRITKIQSVVSKYGEENFYISFSGGKDSTVLSALIDLALPDNKIPRVYANTGIEYCKIVEFVEREREREHAWELHIIKPSLPIKKTLEEVGYPFKSKKHASLLETYQKYKTTEGRIGIQHYLHISDDGINWSPQNSCPDKLRFQFDPNYPLKISDRCCDEMKEKPLVRWQRENNKKYAIIGVMQAEGGRRMKAQCLAFRGNKLRAFQPLAPITKVWEDWFIEQYHVELCELYYPPYNFTRTGCKGCPFAINLQKELDVLEKFFPNERKQCEYIWQPVYEEYRRIGYRLKDKDKQMTLDDFEQ